MNSALKNQALWIVVLGIASLIFSQCSGGGSQGNSDAVTLGAKFSTSVPQGGGTADCHFNCESSLTAGTDNALQAPQQTFPSLLFRCDAGGIPETGQGFEATFGFDPQNPNLETGATLEGSCTSTAGNFLGVFSGTTVFNPQNCGASGACDSKLTMTNLIDQVSQGASLDFLLGLSCSTLSFINSVCFSSSSGSSTTPNGFCTLVAIARTTLGCIQTCGNGILDVGKEECDLSAADGAVCDPDKQCTEDCHCGPQPGCGNAIFEPELGEACDTGFVNEQGTCPDGFVCTPFTCQCTQCGNGVTDTAVGEECDADGFIGTAPECDALQNNSLCNSECVCTQCGNGVVDAGEECDVNGDLAHWTAACAQLGFCPNNCRGCSSESCGGLPPCPGGACPAQTSPSDPILICVAGCCVPQ